MTVEEMFNAYAKNFSFFAPKHQDIFVCPLCTRAFDRTSINAGLLAEEHIIPEAVGGKLRTLTCKQCNNTDGRKIESHFRTGLTMRDVFEGLESHRGAITAGGYRLNADIRMANLLDTKPRVEVVGRKGKTHPDHLNKIQQEFAASRPEGKISFRFKYEEHKYSATFIRIAYLMMFYYYGYSYVVLKTAKVIRDAISNPPRESELYGAIQEIPDKPNISNCVGVVHDPPELRSFLILVTVRTKKERYFAVPLPGFLSPDPYSIYKSMKQLGRFQISYTVFKDDPYYFTHPEMTNSLVGLWKHCITS